ncbi:MAG TPA: hypothetical protein VMJ12_08735 [Candidatus Acidoferrales bacterium]|jgi:hypothetical protein|nr:hypothetical protein [Candidatus Acidoferrales bacterium]
MNPATQPMHGTNSPGEQVKSAVTDGDIELVVEESEQVREHIRMQATEIGPILEALLRDTHGQIRWGLNE